MTSIPNVQTSGGCPFAHAPAMPRTGTPFQPAPQFARWRAEGPATRITAEDGNVGWFVTGYELARKVLEDRRFSQKDRRTPVGPSPIDYSIDSEAGDALTMGNVLGLDPPQHTKVRRVVVGRFSVRSVRTKLPELRDFISRRLDHIIARQDTADLYRDFAHPVSVVAHCLVLGIPDSHADEFAETFAADHLRFDVMTRFAKKMLALKAGDLGGDTISDIVRSDLTPLEQLGILTILMASGRDAVAYMIGTIMVSLLNDTAQLGALRRDPGLIRGAVEEFIRFHAMFISMHPRTVTENVTLDGVNFEAGDPVWVSTVAANRDGERFNDPDRFDVTRDAYGHIGFGHGIHGCIGQQLARVVIQEAITQLLDRSPSMRLIESEQLTPMEFAGDLPTYAPGTVRVAW